MSEIIQHLNWQFIAEEFLELVRDAEHNREQHDDLKAERDQLQNKLQFSEGTRTTLQEAITSLEAERDELQAEIEQVRMERAAAEHLSHFGPARLTPRIITADEMKVGQVVAVHNVENADQVGHWEVVELHSEFWAGMAETNTDNIVLLEDAPEPEEPEQSLADQLCAISDDIRSGKRDTITWEQVKAELEVDDD